MAYTSEQIHTSGHSTGSFFNSSLDWFASQINEFRHRRELGRAEAELQAFPDQLLNDIGLSRGEIHEAVWNGRDAYRRQGK